MRPRNLLIAIIVVLLHAEVIWVVQNGLVRVPVPIVIPTQVLTELIEPDLAPAANTEPAVASTPALPTPKPQSRPERIKPAAPAAIPSTAPKADNGPAPAPKSVARTQEPKTPVNEIPPEPSKIELPSSSAEYLNNPKPPYPPMSRRLGEQGKVVVRVLIGIDGLPQNPTLTQSSGFERLDQTALETVMRWRFVPGRRAGVPEAMWFNVPINFVLQ